MVKSRAISILCHITCAVPLSVCCKSGLIYVKFLQKLRTNTFEKKEQDMFRQYLLPFSSECWMFSSMKVTLFLSFCVGAKFGAMYEEKNTD
jgi:hypothetical protein